MKQNMIRNQLRKTMLNQRLNLSMDAVQMRSRRIIERLRQLKVLGNAQTIMFYSSIRNEVDLKSMLEEERQTGKTVLLPRVRGDMLEAVVFKGWENCRPGAFGILEPEGPAFDPYDIEAVLVPGLAFDQKGYRLGYGKGYYDRFLPCCSPEAFLCGAAYGFQLVETIYPADNDIPLHVIVSDRSETADDMRFF